MKPSILTVTLVAIALPALATAQTTTAPTTSGGKLGGLAGMLGGGVPNVASASAGNAAGLLGYCVKNNLLSGANAASVLGNLSGKSGVATSPGYGAGQQGTLQTGKSQLSLDGLRGQVKTQVCNLVLKRAKSFL